MTIHCVGIVMVGTFPPPVHGMAVVNAAVRDRLKNVGIDIRPLDIAAPGLRRGFFARVGRIPRILRALASLIVMRRLRGQTLYMSVSGGFGQIYELFFVTLARLRGMRLYLHHHSYAYLDRRSQLASSLLGMAGAQAWHVVLTPGMAHRLQAHYAQVRRVVPVSNAALLLGDASTVPMPRNRLGMIGFLGNISAAKGVFVFLDVCAALQARGFPVRCLLAGPFQDAFTERAVRERLAGLSNVEYRGPLYGMEKTRFYAGIDVLLFPSQYANEAEPLVVHEAMAAGTPVIAYDRGAISEIIEQACGVVVPQDADFVALAIAQLEAWWKAPVKLTAASQAAVARFTALREASARRWDTVQRALSGATADQLNITSNASKEA